MRSRFLHRSSPPNPPRLRLMLILLAVAGVLLGLVAMHAVEAGTSAVSAYSHAETHAAASEMSRDAEGVELAEATHAEPFAVSASMTSSGAAANGGCAGLCDMNHFAMAMACALVLIPMVLALRRRTLDVSVVSTPMLLPLACVRSVTIRLRPPSLSALCVRRI